MKVRKIVPLLERLGIDKSSLDFEKHTGSGLIDIFYESPIENRLVIETKNPRVILQESDLQQLLEYQRQTDAIIGLVTNGIDYFLVSHLPLRQKFLGAKILYHFTNSELNNPEVFQILLSFISVDALNNPDLEKSVIAWKENERGGFLSELEELESDQCEFLALREEKLKTLLRQQALFKQSINEINQEITQQKGIFDEQKNIILKELGLTYLRSREKSQNSLVYSRNNSDVQQIPVGLKIFLPYKGEVYTAVVTENHRIRLESGEEYNSPSTAAKKLKESLGSQSPNTNGWTAWRAHLPNGEEVTLDHFRICI